MASKLSKIIRRITGKGEVVDNSPLINLAIFGKHPGWDDHIDDLGMETERLIAVKRILYIQGIGSNIDSGAWNELAEVQRLESFDHIFVWRFESDLIVGRVWSSSDGKGRTSYPMIATVQTRSLPLAWVLEEILPPLEQIRSLCSQTDSATEVNSIFEKFRTDLRCKIDMEPSSFSLTQGLTGTINQLARHPDLGPDHQGLIRILYHIERNVTNPYRSGVNHETNCPSATLLRVPKCAEQPKAIFLLWLQFMLEQLEIEMPLLGVLPITGSWLDLIVGESPVNEIYCFRVTPQALPLTTNIPYEINLEFIERIKLMINH